MYLLYFYIILTFISIIQVKDETDKIAEKKFQKFEQKVTKIEESYDK